MNHNQRTYYKYAQQYHEKRRCEKDNLWNLYLDRPMIERLIGEPSPGMKTLDLGCGSGLLARWLKDKGLDAQGVDFSHSLINIAKTELREAYPHFYERTNTFPSFCGFRARKV